MSARLDRAVDDLVFLSRWAARDLHQVQGAGGNISVKPDAATMLIKSSGSRLSEVAREFGWTRVRRGSLLRRVKRVAKGHPPGARREAAYCDLVGLASTVPGRRPSLEAGFHAAIPERYVVHVHSNAAIILALLGRGESERRLARLLPEVSVYWLPACLPGMELTVEALNVVHRKSSARGVSLWLLENHGAIWSGPKRDALVKTMGVFEKSFRRSFGLRSYPAPHRHGAAGCSARRFRAARLRDDGVRGQICLCRWPKCAFILEPLFPDFIVYFNLWAGAPDIVKCSNCSVAISAADRAGFRDKQEVFHSHAVVSTVLAGLGRRPRTLGQGMIRAIKNLKTERARLRQAAAMTRRRKEGSCRS